MGSFGERLRREREMRGISIEEIAEATKIGSRNLRALEEERFDQLPGGIFNKGFVRAYSKYLGLDEEQAVADYVAAESSFRESSSGQFDVPVENTRRSSKALPVSIVLLLVIGAGGFFGWKYRQKWAAQRDAQQASAVAEQAAHAAPLPPPVAPPTSVSSDPSGTAQPASGTPANASSPAPAPTAATPTPATTLAGTAPAPETTADGFVVQVTAKEDSWVSAKADGKSVLSGTLKATDAKTFRAKDRIILTLGNVGGVQVTYNGKDQMFDRTAKVKTLVFTAQGLQPDAPEQR